MRTPTADLTLPDPAADPAAYPAALLAVVGERDPLAVIVETPGRIRALLDGLNVAALARRPADGEWSAAEILGHLLDDEIINAFRLRMTLTAEQPRYPGTDPEGWAALAKPPLEQVWSAWEGLRAYNLWLLRALPPTDWSRAGLHAEQGPESVKVQILKNAGHDLAHIEQLERWRVETGSEEGS